MRGLRIAQPKGCAVGKTLRLALGMRGGVSLAVWIGGAAAEIDEMRRAQLVAGDGPAAAGVVGGGSFYSRLLELGGYDSVEVDVMSGASAGGLNAVLAAAAMVRGRPVAEMRSTWIGVADLRALLESTADGDEARRSLLGGGYFSRELLVQVRDLLEPADPPAGLSHRLEVFLSATVLGGLPIGIADDQFAGDEARRSEALLHLRHFGDGPERSDLLAGPEAAARLVKAARTTASFPTAFEPVCFEVGELPGILLLPGPSTEAVHLLDGGVVDNIPVARALQGVPNVPSATPTDRWLLYLHPSPGAFGIPTSASKKPEGVLSTVLGLGNAVRSESILDDIEAVRAHNAAAVDSWRVWTAGAGRLPMHPDGPPATMPVAIDAVRLYELLREPATELVWRPLGKAVPSSCLDNVTAEARRQFRLDLERAVNAEPRSVRPYASIVRAAGLLVRWARDLEKHPAGSDACDPSPLKVRAYQLMQVGQLVTAQGDWLALARAEDSNPDGAFASGLVAVLAELVDRIDADARLHELVVSLRREPEPDLARIDGPQRDVIGALLAGADNWKATAPDAPGLRGMLWDELAQTAVGLARCQHDAALSEEPVFNDLADRLDHRGAGGPVDHRPEITEGRLGAARWYLALIDHRTIGAHVGRALGQAREFQYLRTSGASQSPVGLGPRDLVHDGPRFTSARLTVTPFDGAMSPKAKLAGADLANFSAFISQRWRANDWMWGRMDAAKSLVDLVTSPAHLGRDIDVAVQGIKAVVTAPFAEVPDGWHSELTTAIAGAWTQHEAVVRAEVASAVATGVWSKTSTTKSLMVLRRHWELLAVELPVLLATPLHPEHTMAPRAAGTAPGPARPKTVASEMATLSEAIERYEREPRSVGEVWGTRWLDALGTRAAAAFWTATRPERRWQQIVRIPLKPLPMIATGLGLGRHRSLAALALALNLVLVPRLTGITMRVVWVIGVLGLVGLWTLVRGRKESPPKRLRPVPAERWAPLSCAVAVAVAAFGGVLALGPDVEDRWYRGDSPSWLLHHNPYTVGAALGAGLATWLLWAWCRLRLRLPMALLVAALFGAWAEVSRWETPLYSVPMWRHVVGAAGSMWWALAIASYMGTTVAHLAVRWHLDVFAYTDD